MPRVSVGKAELETRPHILYRFYDRTGVLLYVGITVDLAVRMATHAKEKTWWLRVDRSATRIEYYDSRRAALDAERDAIKTEKPLENDQHNEWAEIEPDGEGDQAHALAREIISFLESRDREAVLKRASVGWDDEPISDRDRDLEAATGAVSLLWGKRFDLATMIDELLDLIPDGEGMAYRDYARAEYRESGQADESITAISERALRKLIMAKADAVLRVLPIEEAREWVASGAVLLPGQEHIDHVVFGARYCSLFKQRGVTFRRLCNGPGRHVARCASKANVKTYFELCDTCPAGHPCEGHTRWCSRHAVEAEQGKLSVVDGNSVALLPIARSTPLPSDSDPWPF